ncbi:MAG: HEPN domain-containing protein [Acidobacteriota bacterium]
MTQRCFDEEIEANLERAEQSLRAAAQLAGSGFYDFAASRAYYAAFYAATAALFANGLEFSKHSAVIAKFQQFLVKPGRIARDLGKQFRWLSELRWVGDYGHTRHVPEQEAKEAIAAACKIVRAVQEILESP